MQRRDFIRGGVMAAAAGLVSGTKADAAAKKAKDRVVILSAHPDDQIACTGFTLLTRDIFEFHVIDFTSGQLGLGPKGRDDGSTQRIRMAEEEKACAMIGAKAHWLGGMDGSLYATEGLCDRLVALLEEIKPRAVIAHWPLDHHPDHVMSYALSMKAISRLGKTCENDLELYFMEEPYQARDFRGDYAVDYTSVLDEWKAFYRCYACQNPESSILLHGKACELHGWNLRDGYVKNRHVEYYAAFGRRKAGLKSIFDEVQVK